MIIFQIVHLQCKITTAGSKLNVQKGTESPVYIVEAEQASQDKDSAERKIYIHSTLNFQ